MFTVKNTIVLTRKVLLYTKLVVDELPPSGHRTRKNVVKVGPTLTKLSGSAYGNCIADPP